MDSLPADAFVTSLQFTKNTYQDIYPAIDPTQPALSLAGKVVIVTGASRGVGARGIVPAIAKAGAKGLVLVGTKFDLLLATEAKVREANPDIKTLPVAADISDAKAVASLFAKVAATFGHADVLVSNAAISGGTPQIHAEDPATWARIFDVNLNGTFVLVQAFLRSLPSPNTPATFINLTSGAAWNVYANMAAAYNVSKLAALQLTAFVAAVYPNVTAITVHPGLLETDMLASTGGGFDRFNKDTPELVGGTIVWLASEKAKFLTGRTVCANWSVEDLVARKDEIVAGDLLTIGLKGKFGKEQFE